jgi:Fe-S oxidoreductase/nitrate reductase gamma subunit
MEATNATTTSTRLARWIRGAREFIIHALVQDRVLKNIYPGIMHFMLFWGVTIQILGTIINLMQQELFLPFVIDFPRGNAYLWFELIMDVAGGMILLGGLMALFRRAALRPRTLESRWDDWYAIGLLLLIPFLGFSSEGFRILITQPEWRNWAPIGNLFAGAFSTMQIEEGLINPVHQVLFWAHVISGLVFVGSIPFTKLRHLVTGPLNIVLRPERPAAALEPIENIEEAEKLGVGEVDEFRSILMLDFDACVQCGRCEEVCPSNFSGMPYSPRVLIRDIRDAVHNTLINPNGKENTTLMNGVLDKETPWYCTTCGACIEVCPLFINPVDSVIELRRYLTLTTGDIPGAVGEALMGMERRGNPWSMPKENHAPWVKELGVRILQPGDEVDVLLFIGCAFGYDARSQKAGYELAKILQHAGVDFGVLGAAEGCCGETARRLGHEYLFQVMVEENIAVFNSVSFKSMVTACAHCFNTLKNEYPQFGGTYHVLHHTELLAELVREGRLKINGKISDQLFSYHDSCYLGRYNKIYDAPRQILHSIPELNLSEFPRKKQNAFCCGGGGGHMWMEIDPATRINHRRLQEVIDHVHADTVVTACPYCLIMFEDAINSKGIGDNINVMDISEVISMHMDTEGV